MTDLLVDDVDAVILRDAVAMALATYHDNTAQAVAVAKQLALVEQRLAAAQRAAMEAATATPATTSMAEIAPPPPLPEAVTERERVLLQALAKAEHERLKAKHVLSIAALEHERLKAEHKRLKAKHERLKDVADVSLRGQWTSVVPFLTAQATKFVRMCTNLAKSKPLAYSSLSGEAAAAAHGRAIQAKTRSFESINAFLSECGVGAIEQDADKSHRPQWTNGGAGFAIHCLRVLRDKMRLR